jgi:steroid 5-alpha reductase family enzyme
VHAQRWHHRCRLGALVHACRRAPRLASHRAPLRWWPLAAIVCAWRLRFGGYLIARGAAREPDWGRYVDVRQRWSPRAGVRFFVFLQAQAALTTAFIVPFPWERERSLSRFRISTPFLPCPVS